MLASFIIIGLGGSGGKTIRYLKQAIDEWFYEIGWNEGIPKGWQFLHVDTPLAQDDPVLPGGVPLLPPSEYLPIVEAAIPFNAVDQFVANRNPDLLEGWRVDPSMMSVPITKGAGQYRAVGRTLGLWRAQEIKSRIEGKITEMQRSGAGAQLGRLYSSAFGSDPGGRVTPVPIVVSSLAGGTGSGLFLDVCDLLRSFKLPWTDQSIGVLYAADVFHQLPPADRAGVHANTAAALAELVSGYYTSEGDVRVPGLGDALLMSRSGPAFPFIVGSANTQGVAFGDQLEVYRVMGRCLAAAMTDRQIQNDLTQYTMANWVQRARKFPDEGSEASMLMDARQHGVLEALGFSELELGTSRFQRYAERRLTRDAVDWLLTGHQQRADNQRLDDRMQPDEVIAYFAEEYFVTFLNGLGLNERGPEQNQILEAIDLDDAEKHSRMSRALSDLRESTVAIVGETASSEEWVTTISEQAELWWKGWVQQYEADIRDHGARWAESMEPRVIDAVGRTASLFGLPVAQAVVSNTIDELREVLDELDQERHDFEAHANHLQSDVFATLEGTKGRLQSNFAGLEEAFQRAIFTAGVKRVEGKLRLIARGLAEELVSGFLIPLRDAMRNDTERLRQRLNPGLPDSAPVDNWPRHEPAHDRAVPDDLVPGKSVHPVIAVDTFPRLFDELLTRSLPAETGAVGDRWIAARDAVLTGQFLKELDPVDPVEPWVVVTQQWVPDPIFVVGGSARQSARFELRIERDSVAARASTWLRRPGTAFDRFLGLGLRGYLSIDDPRELQKRRQAYEQALSAAFRSAEPLVNLDVSVLGAIHDVSEIGQRAAPSAIPLRDHPLEEWTRNFLVSNTDIPTESEVDDFLVKDERITKVSVYSMLGGACHPMVMKSLAHPVAEGWGMASDARRVRDFWRWRRSRPLAQALPIPDTMVRAMIRGWFTARLLGLIDIELTDGRLALTLRSRDTTHRFDSFITNPSGDPARNPHRVLASLLESLTVAMSEAARTQRFSEFLGIYRGLADLGGQHGLHAHESTGYDEPNEVLAEWLNSGVAPWGNGSIPSVLSEASDRTARAAALLEHLRNAAAQYDALAATARALGAESLGTDNAWLGLADDMTQEIRRMAGAVQSWTVDDPIL